MNPILNAINQGYSPTQIIKYLTQAYPNLAPKVSHALSTGYSIKEIISYLAQSQPRSTFGKSESQIHKENRDFQSSLVKKGLMGAAIGASNVLSPYLSAGGQSALSRALPPSVAPNSPAPTGGAPASMGTVPSQMQPLGTQPTPPISPQPAQAALPSPSSQQPPVAPIAPNVPTTSNIPQPVQAVQPEVKSILQKHGLLDKVHELAKKFDKPTDIAGRIYQEHPTQMRALEKETGKNTEDLIADYLQGQTPQVSEAPQVPQATPIEPQQAIAPQAEQIIQPTQQAAPIEAIEPMEPEKLIEEPKTKEISKADTVLTPQGVGEVKSDIRNGQAIVEVDGKKHKINVDEIQPEPEEVKKATLDFDINSVPEDLRSAPLNEVYTPADRRHVTVKYNQGLKPVRYIYYRKDGKPVPEEYIAKIREGVQLPITSGLSFWGAWDANKADSRGAANYEELVRNAQEEGQPDDPTKHYWFVKEEGIYEHPYMEHLGKQELRRREKEFNEREKERKRKEKPPKPVKEKKPKKPRP